METPSSNIASGVDLLPVRIQTPDPWPATPASQQSLAGMRCIPLTTGTQLTFTPLGGQGVLVLASAFDKRAPCRLTMRTPTGKWTYELDAGYCSIAQRFHVPIPAGVGEIGITALDEDASFWVLADPEHLPESLPAVWPVTDQVDRLSRFFRRLENDCVAEFGWMGGCVLEAFDALARGKEAARWHRARDRWLAFFLDDQHLVYQDASGRRRVDTYHIIEATLPIASIVRARPNHPIVNITIEYLLGNAGRDATCEGCYTMAYPLMQIAAVRDREDLRDLALRELQSRRDRLFHEGNIYLRHPQTGRTYRNWTRGIAWYLLGNVKCLQFSGLAGQWAPVAEHMAERAAWVIKHQRDDGLWDNFLDEKGPPPDTSGSAGIAASLVHAHELGLIGKEGTEVARRCWAALPQHLFIDGWLGDVAPSNKRGEEAQHGSRRASETFGMGLMGVLAGAGGYG